MAAILLQKLCAGFSKTSFRYLHHRVLLNAVKNMDQKLLATLLYARTETTKDPEND